MAVSRQPDPFGADPVITPAELTWQGDQPVSRTYTDMYHAADGMREVQQMFIAPSRFAQRFAAAASRRWLVGETGFGSGLNFAVLSQLFLRYAPETSRLHFVSFEKHPIAATDFIHMAKRRASKLPVYAELSVAYPPLLTGWHRRHFAQGRICLSVFFGDVATGLRELAMQAGFHAWLLDGFAPDRNPEMWRADLLQRIADLSLSASTVATFTVAGSVRRALAAAGYHLRKLDQTPYKRHSLVGVLQRGRSHYEPPARVTVVGAGIAGCSSARLLAESGVAVDLIDAESEFSANRITAAVLHARLLRDGSTSAAWRAHSFHYASHWLRRFGGVKITGALQTAASNMPPERLADLARFYENSGSWIRYSEATETQELTAGQLACPTLRFEDAGQVNLPHLCNSLCDHPAIKRVAAKVTAMTALGGTAGADGYRLILQPCSETKATYEAEKLVLCSGAAPAIDPLLNYLEMVSVGGQLEILNWSGALQQSLVGEGYYVGYPDVQRAVIGATFEHHPWRPSIARAHNLRRLRHWWPHISGHAADFTWLASMRGTRAVSSDRLPIVGQVYNRQLEAQPNILLNLAHGSNGTTSAGMGADCVASHLLGEFPALQPSLIELISSLRFRQRQARRGYRHGARGESD